MNRVITDHVEYQNNPSYDVQTQENFAPRKFRADKSKLWRTTYQNSALYTAKAIQDQIYGSHNEHILGADSISDQIRDYEFEKPDYIEPQEFIPNPNLPVVQQKNIFQIKNNLQNAGNSYRQFNSKVDFFNKTNTDPYKANRIDPVYYMDGKYRIDQHDAEEPWLHYNLQENYGTLSNRTPDVMNGAHMMDRLYASHTENKVDKNQVYVDDWRKTEANLDERNSLAYYHPFHWLDSTKGYVKYQGNLQQSTMAKNHHLVQKNMPMTIVSEKNKTLQEDFDHPEISQPQLLTYRNNLIIDKKQDSTDQPIDQSSNEIQHFSQVPAIIDAKEKNLYADQSQPNYYSQTQSVLPQSKTIVFETDKYKASDPEGFATKKIQPFVFNMTTIADEKKKQQEIFRDNFQQSFSSFIPKSQTIIHEMKKRQAEQDPVYEQRESSVAIPQNLPTIQDIKMRPQQDIDNFVPTQHFQNYMQMGLLEEQKKYKHPQDDYLEHLNEEALNYRNEVYTGKQLR